MKIFVFCFALMMAAFTVSAQRANDALLLDMYQNQRYLDAVAYLKSVYAEPINDSKVLARFAYTYQMAGKLPDALTYYQRIYDQDSTNVPVLFNLANINLTRDNNTKALFYFQKIINIDSLNFRVNKQLGRMYMQRSDTLNAVRYLRKANIINPEEPEAAADLSAVLSAQNKNKDAEQVLRRALAADTTNIILLRTLMKLNYTMGKYAETIKSCKTLLELGDNSADIFNKEGSSYFELKNYECCIDAFFELPGIYQTERTFYLTAISYKKLKDYNKALEYFDLTLLQSISDNVWAYYSEMGGITQTTHKLKQAALNYQKSLFFKEKQTTLYSLATLYDEELKDKKNALKYYKKYLDTKPGPKEKDYVAYVESRVKLLSGK